MGKPTDISTNEFLSNESIIKTEKLWRKIFPLESLKSVLTKKYGSSHARWAIIGIYLIAKENYKLRGEMAREMLEEEDPDFQYI